MNKQYKKIFSVLFAILIGAGIIYFAWRGGSVGETEFPTSEKNGDWKDSLSVVPQTDTLRTLGASQGSGVANEATTTMDIVARELLTNYTLAQQSMSTTTLSDADAKAIAHKAVSKINLPQAKQFTVQDLNISNDNSPVSLEHYMKEVGTLTQAFTLSQTKNDIAVAFAIPKAGNEATRSADIATNISHYEKLIKGLLAIKTPSLLAVPHLHLIQKYANLEVRIKPMAEIFTDPLKGLAALAEYRKEIAGFSILADEFDKHIPKNQ